MERVFLVAGQFQLVAVDLGLAFAGSPFERIDDHAAPIRLKLAITNVGRDLRNLVRLAVSAFLARAGVLMREGRVLPKPIIDCALSGHSVFGCDLPDRFTQKDAGTDFLGYGVCEGKAGDWCGYGDESVTGFSLWLLRLTARWQGAFPNW